MRILVTNDDGVYSPGIAALAQVATKFGEVRVVAPDVERSSAGQSITASRPLSYKRTPSTDVETYRVNGTPSDCVALGAHNWEKVDVVLSGINLGSNLGNATWHSGTLAAAKQATLFGLRGIAFSTPSGDSEPDFALLKPWVEIVLKMLLDMPKACLLNVNLPVGAPRGILWTRQSVRQYDGKVVAAKDPMGRPHFWFTVIPLENAEEGTDRHAIEQGYVSITPLRLDLTDVEQLAKLKAEHPLDKVTFETSPRPTQ
ncbi:MAG: 5/3-nucleotidase SurE [Betaproteobacteria bacterium]|nr:5/3-nucleotidase SurE [Betaproteobacteria bacterium]